MTVSGQTSKESPEQLLDRQNMRGITSFGWSPGGFSMNEHFDRRRVVDTDFGRRRIVETDFVVFGSGAEPFSCPDYPARYTPVSASDDLASEGFQPSPNQLTGLPQPRLPSTSSSGSLTRCSSGTANLASDSSSPHSEESAKYNLGSKVGGSNQRGSNAFAHGPVEFNLAGGPITAIRAPITSGAFEGSVPRGNFNRGAPQARSIMQQGLAPYRPSAHQGPFETRSVLAGAGTNQAQPSNSVGVLAPIANFHPMSAVDRPQKTRAQDDPQRGIKERAGISPNYGGDATIARNHSADIPHQLNCSLWVTNLPAHVTHHMLLSQIRGMGRIYACVINPPKHSAGHHTAAAKVVFFELAAAQSFYTMCSNPSRRLIVGGMVARVSLNRIRSAEYEPASNKSRVLVIKGVASFVNEYALTAWFRSRFTFEIDEIITHVLTEEMGHMEYRFGSYRCQAESARMALVREFPVTAPSPIIWEIRFGVDPCSV